MSEIANFFFTRSEPDVANTQVSYLLCPHLVLRISDNVKIRSMEFTKTPPCPGCSQCKLVLANSSIIDLFVPLISSSAPFLRS
jgi:hypothetical protein